MRQHNGTEVIEIIHTRQCNKLLSDGRKNERFRRPLIKKIDIDATSNEIVAAPLPGAGTLCERF
jgi:hypothetical protein